MVYLDNAATTKPSPAVISAMTEALEEQWGNPSSTHELGRQAALRLRAARHDAASALGCADEELIFTSGGTESDNWAVIKGFELMRRKGSHVITTAVEHHAVLEPVEELKRLGAEVTCLKPDALGRISLEDFTSALRTDTVLCSVMMINNESGAVMPIAEMCAALRRSGSPALFHCDAVQGFMKQPFSAKKLGVDMLSVSGHKIHAGKGIGAMFIKSGVKLKPLILGGGQESGRRSGTEPMPQILGFAAACRDGSATLERDISHMSALRDMAKERILSALPGAVLIGAMDAPHIVNLSLPGIRSQGIINCLQDKGVYVSAGSACSKGRRSHVLEAMGTDARLIDGSIRVSFSRDSTSADVDALVSALVYAKSTLKG